MKLEVYKPDGTLYGEYQNTTPPISIDIPNPEEGLWTYNVTALNIPYISHFACSIAKVAN